MSRCDSVYILDLYPCYNRNRIGNRSGRYRDICSWSRKGLRDFEILTLFSHLLCVSSDSCREQLDNCYYVILALRCLTYISNRIQNWFGSYGDCMSWSMIFLYYSLHYKGIVCISHLHINFWRNVLISVQLILFVPSSMLIYNLQSDSESVR